MAKSKILFILHLPPPVHGAGMVGKFIKESAVINQRFETDYMNLATSESIDQIGKAGISKLFTFLKILGTLLKSFTTKKYDLYYMTLTATGPGFYKDAVIVLLLKLFGKKLIYHFHNKGIAERNNIISKCLYRFVFRNTNSILLSPSLYKDIRNYAKPDHVFFCANGIPEVSKETTLSTEKKEDAPCNFLFLSNLIKEKGVYVLLEACSLLKEMKLNFICHFVGPWEDVTEKEFYARVSAYQLNENILVHGRKYGAEKQQVLQLADVFVFPTFYHNECFPLVLLEAMQFSLPVVSTYEGGIPDIVKEGETGFLVHQKNASALAEKMKVLVENPSLRKDMGKAGLNRFKENFTLELFENNLAVILQEVITRNRMKN